MNSIVFLMNQGSSSVKEGCFKFDVSVCLKVERSRWFLAEIFEDLFIHLCGILICNKRVFELSLISFVTDRLQRAKIWSAYS